MSYIEVLRTILNAKMRGELTPQLVHELIEENPTLQEYINDAHKRHLEWILAEMGSSAPLVHDQEDLEVSGEYSSEGSCLLPEENESFFGGKIIDTSEEEYNKVHKLPRRPR